MLDLKGNWALLLSLIIGLNNPIISQEYYKVIPTSAYPLSSLRNNVVIGQRLMNDGMHVAFEAYHGRPGRTNSYYGYYSSAGDLISWHELPDSNNTSGKKVYFFDSIYINSYSVNLDTTQLYSVNYNGSINWATQIDGLFDSYSYNRTNPDSLFALDTNGYFTLIDLKQGIKAPRWRADSLFTKVEDMLLIDSLMSLNRVGVDDSVEFYEISYVDSNRLKRQLVQFLSTCKCWTQMVPLDGKQLILQESSPLIFSQGPIQLLGDSMESELLIQNSKLDTLWIEGVKEPAFLKIDSTFITVPTSISLNDQGYFLLEVSRSRRSNTSFIQHQFQMGVNYIVLDSTFQQVIDLTIWPKDTIGRVIDVLYSSNPYVESCSKFYLDSNKALTVIISRDQRGLGEPLLMIHRTGNNGISFLDQKVESINGLLIEVFPNPIDHNIIVTNGGKAGSYFAEVLNVQGTTMKAFHGIYGQTVPLKEINSGMHYLLIRDSSSRMVKCLKILKR